MNYQVIRSRRKTVSLQLDRQGNVIVRAPLRCPDDYIEDFVQSHARWIQSHQRTLLDRKEKREQFRLEEGTPIRICGEEYHVHVVPGLKARLRNGQLILSSADMDHARPHILRIAREQGEPWARKRLDQWAFRMGISWKDVKLSTARTRWGSCSRDGVIRLSVWLLFAPEPAIDYVMVHELSHRRHFDHSKAFWEEVGRILPDYAERKKLLRAFQNDPFLQKLAEKQEK